MLRTILLVGLLALTGLFAFRWAVGDPTPTASGKPAPPARSGRDGDPLARENASAAAEREKFEPRPAAGPRAVALKPRGRLPEPIVITDARVGLIEFPEVAVARPGKIVLLGTEAEPGTPFDPERMTRVRLTFLGVPVTEEETRKLAS